MNADRNLRATSKLNPAKSVIQRVSVRLLYVNVNNSSPHTTGVNPSMCSRPDDM